MPIVSSQIVEDRAQIDGRRSIRVRHVDSLGREQFADYLAPANFDASAAMLARVASLNADLIDLEQAAVRDWVFAGKSIAAYPFAEQTVRYHARKLMQFLRDAEPARVYLPYVSRVAATPVATVANLLGISQASANGIIQWAAGIAASFASQDTAKSDAAGAFTEVGS